MRAPGAVELMEEAVGLLREAPVSTLAVYLLGSVPFMVGLLFFVVEMTHSPFASERLAVESLLVTLLFAWRKVWQSLLMHRLYEQVSCGTVARRSIPSIALRQWALQPFSLVVLPLALLVTLPYASCVAFFRNASLFSAWEKEDAFRQARQQAVRWNGQNWQMLGIVAACSVLLFGNVLAVFIALPKLVQTFTGVEGDLARIGDRIANVTTFFAAAVVTWLVIDLLLSAIYVLRCFYGLSIHTGADLRAALRKATQVAALLAMMTGATQSRLQAQVQETVARTQPAPVNTERLNASIQAVVRRPAYAWRAPKDARSEPSEPPSWLRAIGDNVGRALRYIGRKLNSWLGSRDRSPQAPPEPAHPTVTLWIGVGAAALFGIGLVQFLRRRRSLKPVTAATGLQPVTAPVDLTQASVAADQLPEQAWLALADQLAAQSDYRLALRAIHLAGLNFLSQRKLITIQRWKTNSDYRSELKRRARIHQGSLAPLVPLFAHHAGLFEHGWYGVDVVDRVQVDQLRLAFQEMKSYAEQH